MMGEIIGKVKRKGKGRLTALNYSKWYGGIVVGWDGMDVLFVVQ
jgi:hypothetical protein